MHPFQEVRVGRVTWGRDVISKSNLLVFFGMFIASSWCFGRKVDGSIKRIKISN